MKKSVSKLVCALQDRVEVIVVYEEVGRCARRTAVTFIDRHSNRKFI